MTIEELLCVCDCLLIRRHFKFSLGLQSVEDLLVPKPLFLDFVCVFSPEFLFRRAKALEICKNKLRQFSFDYWQTQHCDEISHTFQLFQVWRNDFHAKPLEPLCFEYSWFQYCSGIP